MFGANGWQIAWKQISEAERSLEDYLLRGNVSQKRYGDLWRIYRLTGLRKKEKIGLLYQKGRIYPGQKERNLTGPRHCLIHDLGDRDPLGLKERRLWGWGENSSPNPIDRRLCGEEQQKAPKKVWTVKRLGKGNETRP